jgi:hypothetical protein
MHDQVRSGGLALSPFQLSLLQTAGMGWEQHQAGNTENEHDEVHETIAT